MACKDDMNVSQRLPEDRMDSTPATRVRRGDGLCVSAYESVFDAGTVEVEVVESALLCPW
jgi:hypothetical protein